MADIAKVGSPSLSTLQPDPGVGKLPTLPCGEAIQAGDACYIKSDGKIWRSIGTTVNAAAKVRGYAPMDCPVGEVLTLYHNSVFRYGAGLTPGADVYLSSTGAGVIADAASTGGTAPIGFVVDATRIFLRSSFY